MREEQLSTLFAEVLGVPDIAPDDSFFDLGGHSLLASKLVRRIHAQFGVKVTLRRFYEAPTVSAVLRELDRLSA
ncbi:acyl carrier protein [Lentzea sp. NPDC060358]|uniref:acyl carrier protein n=1 Tax=Lentzea sp. NPDC060358 TaxID=3347103 RepID=UPI0036511054